MEIVIVLTIIIQILAVINFLLFWFALTLYGDRFEGFANCGFDLLLLATIHTLYTFQVPKIILEVVIISFILVSALELYRRNNFITILVLFWFLIVLILIEYTFQDAEFK